MPFLALFLRVTPLQKEIPNAAQTPGGASLYKALLHALAPNDEALDELFHQNGASTHITVYPLKSDEGEQRIRVTVCGQHALTATHTLLSALAGQAASLRAPVLPGALCRPRAAPSGLGKHMGRPPGSLPFLPARPSPSFRHPGDLCRDG